MRDLREDEVLKNGEICCKRCGGVRQRRLTLFGTEQIVECLCDCEAEQRDREEAEAKRRARMIEIRQLRANGLQDASLARCTFANDRGYCKRPRLSAGEREAARLCRAISGHAKARRGAPALGRHRHGENLSRRLRGQRPARSGRPRAHDRHGEALKCCRRRLAERAERVSGEPERLQPAHPRRPRHGALLGVFDGADVLCCGRTLPHRQAPDRHDESHAAGAQEPTRSRARTHL